MQFNIELFDKVTDSIERYFAIISKWSSTHQELIKLIFGVLVLLYNPRLSCTILLINCTKATSYPLLIQSLDELSKAYRKTKAAIKEHGPTLTGQLQKVAELTKELREVEKSIKTITDGAVPTATLQKVAKDIETLASVSQEGIETGRKIRSQLDYTTLYKVLGNLYLLTLTAVASARNSTATSLSIGLSLGNSITSNLKNLIKKYETKIYAEAKKLDEKLESSSDINQRIAGALFNPESLIGNLNAAATFIGIITMIITNTITIIITMIITIIITNIVTIIITIITNHFVRNFNWNDSIILLYVIWKALSGGNAWIRDYCVCSGNSLRPHFRVTWVTNN